MQKTAVNFFPVRATQNSFLAAQAVANFYDCSFLKVSWATALLRFLFPSRAARRGIVISDLDGLGYGNYEGRPHSVPRRAKIGVPLRPDMDVADAR